VRRRDPRPQLHLHLGLLAAGVGPGDEVIVPSFTFAATANSVALTGATPVFADIEPDYFGLAPAAVEAVVAGRIPQHAGRVEPLDMDSADQRPLRYRAAARFHAPPCQDRDVETGTGEGERSSARTRIHRNCPGTARWPHGRGLVRAQASG
jgi:hypothetical protein